jgi:SAM-dependent methyltransferase
MMIRVPSRLQDVVDPLELQPDNRVLEIGCGHGVAATLVCERLVTGRLTAVDRSARMIAAAEHRNATYVEDGRAEFLLRDLEALDLGERRLSPPARAPSPNGGWHPPAGCTRSSTRRRASRADARRPSDEPVSPRRRRALAEA